MSKEEKLPVEEKLPTKEAYYEYVRNHKDGPQKVDDPDSEVWTDSKEGLLVKPTGIAGTFIVNVLVRGPRGDVIGKKNLTCLHMEPNEAQETLRRFNETGNHVDPGSGKGFA